MKWLRIKYNIRGLFLLLTMFLYMILCLICYKICDKTEDGDKSRLLNFNLIMRFIWDYLNDITTMLIGKGNVI
jgi:hypothetical protein